MEYALIHRPGPAWDHALPFHQQPLVALHIEHMESLLAAGMLVLGGPFTDDAGGLCIVRANSPAEAREMAERDASVKAGLLTVEVHPWRIVMREDAPPAG